MKFAFTTTPAAPEWDVQTLAARAREYGYDGVELASVPADLPGTRAALQAANVEVACVASRLEMPAGRRARAAGAAELRTLIDAAAEFACGRVRIQGARVHAGQNANSVAVEMGGWLMPAGDYAAERGVTILVQNALSFRKSRDLWMLLESINHPNIAACWDLAAGIAAGESPFVSVPTLNTRIQHVLVGAADETLANFITRLRGIGYGGYVTVQSPADMLPEILGKLREWTKPQAAKPAPRTVKPALATN
ncbi:MAG: xylose isomerase [Phycisphaerales bacterium]|nr:xylose isomerase [Phycisphaerales bacterium]